MSSPIRSIRVGFRQRLAPSLVQDFYPEGMPADWRNNYLVMLTGAIWISDGDADFSAALAAVADAPRPVLAVVRRSGEQPLPEAFGAWSTAHPAQSVMVVGPDEAFWRPESGATGCRIGLLPAQDQPQVLRTWIESFAAQAPVSECALFIEGASPSVATLERLQTLLELMGW